MSRNAIFESYNTSHFRWPINVSHTEGSIREGYLLSGRFQLRFRSKFHFGKLHGAMVVTKAKPAHPSRIDHVSQVTPVQVGLETPNVPPGSGPHNCTVITRQFTIIVVFGGEFFPVVIRQRVSRCTRERAHGQPVQRQFIAYCKLTIFGIASVLVPVLHLHSQLARSAGRQAMDLVESQPELAGQVSETCFVLVPTEIEVLGAVFPSLEHCPPSSVCGHVAVNRESSFAVRVDSVHATCGDVGLLEIRTICRSWKRSDLKWGTEVIWYNEWQSLGRHAAKYGWSKLK